MQKLKLKRWIPHIVAGVIITLVWSFWFAINYWGWATMLATFLIGSIGATLLIDRQNRSFTKRIQSDKVVTWDVFINGVNWGSVTDAQYAAMQQAAFNDWYTAMKQFFVVGRVIQTIIVKLCFFVPFVVFWAAAVTVIVITPESFSEIVQEIQNTTPGEIILTAKSFLKACITFSVITICFLFAIGEQFGFKNAYSDAVTRMIKQQLLILPEGEMRLERVNKTIKSESTINETT